MVVGGGILVFWDDPVFEVSKKFYGTSPLKMPTPIHELCTYILIDISPVDQNACFLKVEEKSLHFNHFQG